jgi:hypothetical protein
MLIPALLATLVALGFQVDSAEFANVVYPVSCLTGSLACTKASIEKFWHEDLHLDARRSTGVRCPAERHERGGGQNAGRPGKPVRP